MKNLVDQGEEFDGKLGRLNMCRSIQTISDYKR